MITGIDHIMLNVEDVGRAASDYAAVLGRNAFLDPLEPRGEATRLQTDNGLSTCANPRSWPKERSRRQDWCLR